MARKACAIGIKKIVPKNELIKKMPSGLRRMGKKKTNFPIQLFHMHLLKLLASILVPVVTMSQSSVLFIGTYTDSGSKGIYQVAFDEGTGKATLKNFAETSNPSYLAVSPDGRFLFAVNENGKPSGGTVSSFAIDKNGELRFLSQQPSGGDDPCYVSVDATGRWLAVGNYSSGTFSLYPVEEGTIREATIETAHKGSSITDRQKGPHVHATVFSPGNDFLLVSNLGTDELYSYPFDARSGRLGEPEITSLPPGSGPRHLVFSEKGDKVYLICELSGRLHVFNFSEGRLTPLQQISAIPSGYNGKFTAADIHLHPNGSVLYTSIRDDLNTISVFNVREQGSLEWSQSISTKGKTPRNFVPAPGGKFLLVANQGSSEVVIFRLDDKGQPVDTGERIQVPKPVCLKWLRP